jgi:hypothetical protein
VTTEPVSNALAVMPKYVRGTIAALRKQCFQMIFHSGSPLMRVSLTNSVSSTSSIEERVRRMSAAT